MVLFFLFSFLVLLDRCITLDLLVLFFLVFNSARYSGWIRVCLLELKCVCKEIFATAGISTLFQKYLRTIFLSFEISIAREIFRNSPWNLTKSLFYRQTIEIFSNMSNRSIFFSFSRFLITLGLIKD